MNPPRSQRRRMVLGALAAGAALAGCAAARLAPQVRAVRASGARRVFVASGDPHIGEPTRSLRGVSNAVLQQHTVPLSALQPA